MTQICKDTEIWEEFIQCIRKNCSEIEYENWFAPIKVIKSDKQSITLEVPNIFVKEYLLDNYKKDLLNFFPSPNSNDPAIEFIVAKKNAKIEIKPPPPTPKKNDFEAQLNQFYTFDNFIEGPTNQFVKSAAIGVASKPGKTFNPLFIHGGVGLGKTHLLHGIGHYVKKHHKKMSVQCITTEAFINDLVTNLRNKSVDKMKRFYRNLDILLVDDIQFLQNRLNFEEEFCNTFESLINQNKQIIITSDKPPGQLKLSERIIARMEWGLVAHLGIPELETRVAIIEHKASLKDIVIPNEVAFFIADHIYNNIRQLEGAINRLSAFARLMHCDITVELAENILKELLDYHADNKKITVEGILKSVSTVFEVRVSEIKGESRLKNIAKARQVAMYLAKELIDESLMKIASSFGGKTHSTLIHAWKKIAEQLDKDSALQKQISIVKRNIES